MAEVAWLVDFEEAQRVLSPVDKLPSQAALDAAARAVLEAHWRPAGYCVPNEATYPFQWLWDSCFHAVVWSHLGEPARALSELRHLFRTQDAAGFVPHVDYEVAPDHHRAFWGRSGSSSITQPPMYGHALAVLARRGSEVPWDLADAAERGLRFLLEQRARDEDSGLITVVHPWESGCDDSPRWDHWCPGGFEPGRWYEVKGRLVDTIEYSRGAPVANPAFGAAPVGFNALVAFNAAELATVRGDADLAQAAADLGSKVRARWDAQASTWVDAGPAARTSGRSRTLDALMVSLLDEQVLELGTDRGEDALVHSVDAAGLGGACGPAGVHRDDAAFCPDAYWRGAAWPHLTYLLWCAAERRGSATGAVLAEMLVRGAHRSGFAEYWHPDTGQPLGARPQSWSTLAAVVRSSIER